ncbi:MAG TPA: DUF4239 domain-containing protein [Steroidobacteraceae bacterium]|nr:DUF4239 domain-containing protein [Steroidobacteraceae bacterium]
MLLLVILLTGLAMSGPILIRRYVTFDRLRVNNEVAGFKFATIGVLYAVLLGFVVIIAWERFHEAERALATEAGASATVYRLAGGLTAPLTAEIRSDLEAYLRSVDEDDWPAMAVGRWSPATTDRLNALYDVVVHIRPTELHDFGLQQDLMRELDKVGEARRERLISANGSVPGAIWFVLLLGALLTIGFTYFFATQNEVIQGLMTGVLAALIFSAILVVVVVDRPFTGAVRVHSEPIRWVLEDMSRTP